MCRRRQISKFAVLGALLILPACAGSRALSHETETPSPASYEAYVEIARCIDLPDCDIRPWVPELRALQEMYPTDTAIAGLAQRVDVKLGKATPSGAVAR